MLFDPMKTIERREGGPVIELQPDPIPTDPNRKRLVVLTYGLLAARALDAKFEDERHMGAEVGIRRYILATRIVAAEYPIDLSIEEAQMVKECTCKAYAPALFAPIHLALDAAAKGPELSTNAPA